MYDGRVRHKEKERKTDDLKVQLISIWRHNYKVREDGMDGVMEQLNGSDGCNQPERSKEREREREENALRP